MEDWQIIEAQRIADFQRSEDEHIADGTYDRFVDGFFLDRSDESRQLHGEKRLGAFACGTKQAKGECIKVAEK